MGKRTVFEANSKTAYHEPHPKRQRIEHSRDQESPRPVGGAEEVLTARQLQSTLVFDQGAASNLRSGLSQFKRFLDSILYSTEEHALPRQRAILREYLDSQKGKGWNSKDNTFIPNLIQAWDYAAETNFEALLAQITAVLALLFKVFSSHRDFLEYGTLLTKAILQPSVARRLVRSTSAATNKENIISPALRLLTELTKFNEGANARAVYSKKDFTLEPKILGRNIALWKESKDQSVDDLHKKPSVRTTAIRYLLTHLRYQDERAKIEILSNSNIVRALFDHLVTDPPFLIFEIFDVLKNHVFQDKAIPRSTKSRILNGRALSRIASLYSYNTADGSLPEEQKAPDELAHEFLCMVCTDPGYGIMLPTTGFYPSANEDDEGDVLMEDTVDYGVEFTLDTTESYQKTGRIRNVVLADFLQNQKPYANILHQQLVVAIFKACPELVADYFVKKQEFNYDPKLTSTWIGYSAFLYQTIELPVPPYFGARRTYREHPPPVTAMIQSILPQPLTQQVLSRCLNHSSDLIQFFAMRVLIVAFHKLRAFLDELSNASFARTSKPWEQASRRLITEFSQRCPPVKAIILAMKKPAFQKDMKREAITRLLRLYFEVTPQVALQEKFDVSLPLCNALLEVEKPVASSDDKAFRIMELEHWIQIARHSPAMRWWQKHKSLPHSPFVTLIKLLVASKDSELYAGIRFLLVDILRDQDMLQTTTSPNALDALVASLGAPSGPSSPSPEVLNFLDDCCARFVKVPIKYFDDLDAICAPDARTSAKIAPVSPLLLTLVEQWPFKGGKQENEKMAEPLAKWLSRLLYLLKLVGEDELILGLVRDSMVESAIPVYKDVLKDSFLWKMGKERAKVALKLATGADFSGSERSSTSPIPQEKLEQVAKPKAVVDLEQPPEEDEKHNGLVRWRKKDIEEAIDDGDIGELLLCLCSKHTEIRLQAVNNIRQLMATIGNEEGGLQQLYVLLGIMLESSENVESGPMPYVGGVLAARCVAILADPTHFMFSKINKFLVRLPLWQVGSLPRKFWGIIVASEPEEDTSYHREVDWFFDYLIDCLRTPEDMEIFRKNNLFERLLSYYVSKSCSNLAKEKIVRLLLRAAAVGGSTTLITRCGLVSWLQMMLEKQDDRHGTLRVVASRVYETCDQDKVASWSSNKVAKAVAAMTKVETGA